MGFKDVNTNKINKLENVLKKMNESKKNIVELFDDFEVSKDVKLILTQMNLEISNKQFIVINEMVDFIQKQNYRGDEYNKRRQQQIDATKFWLNLYFPDAKEFDNGKKNIIELTNKLIEERNTEAEQLKKSLEF